MGETVFRALTATAIANVDRVRVRRGTGTLEISFDTPRRVSLGPETTTTYGWSPRTRPLFVRVAAGALPATVALTTTFRTL
jgi:hypothetical protein